MSSDTPSTSDSNTNLVEQFCAVTGATTEKAEQLLEVCNWNLEIAINMHVDGDILENGEAPKAETDEIRAPIPQTRGVLVEEDLSAQYGYGLRSRKRRQHTVFDGFRDFRAEAEMEQQSSYVSGSSADKKRRTLESLFRPPLDLMHRGNFESAREEGQKSNRWLMVNLQNSMEFACQVLNRDVWSSPDVKRLVSQHFVFWQAYSDSLDGTRYMQFYNPVEYPYIAVLDPRTGENLIVWHDVTESSIQNLIADFLKSYHCPDGSVTETQPQAASFSLLDKSEEEQLKAALAASIQDSVKINDQCSDVETFESDSESNDAKPSSISVSNQSDHSNDTIDVVSLTENSIDNLNENETWKDFLGGDNDPKSDLVLRLPDGQRQQVTWPCTTKLKSLLLYVAEIGYDPKRYEIVTNFPRRNICQLDLYKTLKEVNLFPREMIFVQLKA